ncbi:uncharacterized protein [Ptychodera flava]|uniref:uncharacterized protein n=1 Tax=Ptychodera flava TaxID=63121 RepID=UPI00396A0915
MAEIGDELWKGFSQLSTNGVENSNDDTKRYKTQTKIVFTPKPKPPHNGADAFPTEMSTTENGQTGTAAAYAPDLEKTKPEPKFATSTKVVLSANVAKPEKEKTQREQQPQSQQAEWIPSFETQSQDDWTPSFELDSQQLYMNQTARDNTDDDFQPNNNYDDLDNADAVTPQSEWVPSFDMNADQLYLNQASGGTSQNDFVPNNMENEDEDNRKSVYKYDGSMVFDKANLQEGGIPIDFSAKERVKQWDPTPLVKELYCQTQELPQGSDDGSIGTCRMEGYIEKLPIGQSKATLMKGWKRRYFRAKEGNLFYYEDNQKKKPIGFVQLMGSTITDSGNKTLEIRDEKGRLILLKFGSTAEIEDWKVALIAEAREGDWKPTNTASKSIVIVDIGTCSVRAGILPDIESEQAVTAPQLFFPTICATDKKDESKKYYGFEALPPEVREKCQLSFPIRHSMKMDRLGLNMAAITDVFEKVFEELAINPTQYTVVVVTHRNLGLEGKVRFADVLFNHFDVAGIYIQEQSIFALYSYNTTTGVIVDVGEHINVVPVVDGFVLEGGVSRLYYGGRESSDHLNRLLTESGYKSYKYSTQAETFIPRFLKEKVCYVAQDFDAEMSQCGQDAGLFTATVDLEPYDLPDQTKSMTFDSARFRCCEGLFNPGMWGVDNVGLPKLIHKAVQTCSIDVRRQMCRSIYLSGGVTLTQGLPERLQAELVKLFPKSLVIQIHASAERYHAAYLGACILSSLNAFSQMCVTREDYATKGPATISKWETL